MILLLFILLFAWPVEAADIFVDNSAGCPGSGTTGSPYCSIHNAFSAPPSAGDHIKIRTGTGTYEHTSIALLTASGSSGNPIVIEPDTGASFIIRATTASESAIELQRNSYITVQNLTFDGNGINTAVFGLVIRATTSVADGDDMLGIQILNNTFQNWGGNEANVSGNATRGVLVVSGGYCEPSRCPAQPIGTIVRGNTFANNRQVNIFASNTKDMLVEDNTFTGTKCGRDVDQAVNALGIKMIGDGGPDPQVSTGSIIRGNTMSDWDDYTSCGIRNEPPNSVLAYDSWNGIWCDVAQWSGTVEKNKIYNIDDGNTDATHHASAGILIEAGCEDWTVRNNVVWNIGYFGMSHRLTGDTDPNNWTMQPTKFYHNTVKSNGPRTLGIGAGKAIIKNNIFYGTPSNALMSISYAGISGSYDIDYNVYYNPSSSTNTGCWGVASPGCTPKNLSGWQTDCSCDSHSQFADPKFVGPLP